MIVSRVAYPVSLAIVQPLTLYERPISASISSSFSRRFDRLLALMLGEAGRTHLHALPIRSLRRAASTRAVNSCAAGKT